MEQQQQQAHFYSTYNEAAEAVDCAFQLHFSTYNVKHETHESKALADENSGLTRKDRADEADGIKNTLQTAIYHSEFFMGKALQFKFEASRCHYAVHNRTLKYRCFPLVR